MMSRPFPTLFITGTDTDVGKTFVSLLCLRVLARHNPVYLKPVQTGCADPDHDSDPAFVARHLPGGLPRGMQAADCMSVCWRVLKAPLFAGPAFDLRQIIDFVHGHTGQGPVVVEGAGGILVPLDWRSSMLDLAQALQAQVLVVARAGLGTINHSLLTVQAIQGRGCACCGVILMDAYNTVDGQSRRENMQAIARLGGVPVWGVIGQENPDTPSAEALNIIEQSLGPISAKDQAFA